MIEITNLNYKYDILEPAVLNNIDIEIVKGDYIAIIGPNGCGKTTLIRHINGLLIPFLGDVWVDGKNTKDPISLKEIRSKVGMVFQNPDNQIVGMSVEEDVSFGPCNLMLPSEEIQKRVKKSLELVNMADTAQKAPHNLSNGEKQLIAIAGVLAMEPEYIILDEPASYLDPSSKKRIMEVISRLNSQGIGIIHVTHDMDEAARADKIIVMENGKVIMYEKPSHVFGEIELLKKMGLDVPKVYELAGRLRESGIELREDLLTMDEICKEIASSLKQRIKCTN